MKQNDQHPTRKKNRWLNMSIIIVVIVFLALVTGVFLVKTQFENKERSKFYYRERMAATATEPGLTPAEIVLQKSVKQQTVNVGMYIDRFVGLSMKDLNWVVDCYVWFNWQDSSLSFGDNFQLVDGWIESKEKKDACVVNGQHYVLYRIVARISHLFEELRFPCDDHLLTVCIEIPSYTRDKLLFQADSLNSSLSSRVKVPGYKIYKVRVVEKPHSYKTSRGDPRIVSGAKSTFSQFRMGLWIQREGQGFFLKMFLPLFVSVAVALLAFFVNPAHSAPRFSLGVGALFAAVANSYINSSMLPNTGVLALADVINIVGITTILLTLIASAISLYIHEKSGNSLLRRRFDTISFCCMLAGYILLNLALPLAAVN
jgi:hypothetical protein